MSLGEQQGREVQRHPQQLTQICQKVEHVQKEAPKTR